MFPFNILFSWHILCRNFKPNFNCAELAQNTHGSE